MLWSVDHGPSLICMSVSNFSHLDISIRIVAMEADLESLQLLSSPEQ